MKQFYLLCLALFAIHITQAQIVNIPDANFKNALVNTSCTGYNREGGDVDTNDDGEIQVSEAEAVTTNLYVDGQNISSLIGIEAFINLDELTASNNQLSTINISSSYALYGLNLSNNLFTTTDDIIFSTSNNLIGFNIANNQLTTINTNNFPESLDYFNCSNNQVTTLDISTLSNLAELFCDNNPLTSLIIDENPVNGPYNVYHLNINNTNLTHIDLSSLSVLYELYCSNNPYLTSLDLNGTRVDNLYCENNASLETISFKNGFFNINGDGVYGYYNLCNNPNLSFICADEGEIESREYTYYGETGTIYGIRKYIDDCGYTDVTINSYCNFEPGGNFNIIQGSNTFDANANGCDAGDLSISNLKYTINSGGFNGKANGEYKFYVGDYGTHTIAPDLENPEYFSVTPENFSVNFQTDTSPYTQDFCITPIGTHNDLDITILPIEAARPGFDTDYKLVYKNIGTTTLSGTVDLMFQDDVMDFVSADPTVDAQVLNNLSWNYSNLEPLESREILFTMNLNTPMETPAVNGDDVLVFTTTVNPTTGDETPQDNVFTLNQTVVNSYDPNDKTCLEGNTITPDLIGNYVHYMIRFENTGTASAINVVVKDVIDTDKFDVSTLYLTDSSHDLVTNISNTNVVEFIFEGINLPFDDANNDGYIAFKIKTLATLVEGDTFENGAEIYFDYNFPIITNQAKTDIKSALSANDFEMTTIALYPNPAQNELFIEGENGIKSVTIYDISGRLIHQISYLGFSNSREVSTENLVQGTYLVQIKTESGESIRKIVKE